MRQNSKQMLCFCSDRHIWLDDYTQYGGLQVLSPVNQSKLKGKFVAYHDKDWKYRVNIVVKVYPRYLTVKDCLGARRRVPIEKVLMMHTKTKTRDIIWDMKPNGHTKKKRKSRAKQTTKLQNSV